MPYIDQESRDRLNGEDHPVGYNHPHGVGQLTYDLQQSLKRYIEDHGLKYATLAECLGALEGAKIDLTERVVAPYEAHKRQENGDVWPEAMAPWPPYREILPLDQNQLDTLLRRQHAQDARQHRS